MMKIGIVGLGFVGGAMLKSFQIKSGELGSDDTFYGYDKYKNGGIGSLEECLETDLVFLALPTPYNSQKKRYQTEAIYETVKVLSEKAYEGAIVIKSTVEPETLSDLSKRFSLNLIHNPEFLTARTAFQDFHQQQHIVLGASDSCQPEKLEQVISFYSRLYPEAEISRCRATESEMMKIFLNTFYATKVQVFTEFYLMCQKLGVNYDHVKSMMLKNNWINPMHTMVPGPDGQVSYGGLCFPKDTNALVRYSQSLKTPMKVVEAVIEERNQMRDDHDNCM